MELRFPCECLFSLACRRSSPPPRWQGGPTHNEKARLLILVLRNLYQEK